MPTLSITIQKGGSAKTTTAINLGAALQRQDQRVLLVDIDPQANLTQVLGGKEVFEQSVYSLLQAEANGNTSDVSSAIINTTSGLHVLPATLELANAELELVSVFGREKLLTGLLKQVQTDYDWIIIDCPPAIGMLTVNALAASDYWLMPLQGEFFSLMGVRSFLQAMKRIQKLNEKLELLGMVLTLFDNRKIINREVLATLQNDFGDKVFETKIRRNIALVHAQEKGKTIFEYAPNSNGSTDYEALAAEFLERLK